MTRLQIRLAFVVALALAACGDPLGGIDLPRGEFRGTLTGSLGRTLTGVAESDSSGDERFIDRIYLVDSTVTPIVRVRVDTYGMPFRVGKTPFYDLYGPQVTSPRIVGLVTVGGPFTGFGVQSGTLEVTSIRGSEITGRMTVTGTHVSIGTATLEAEFRTRRFQLPAASSAPAP